MLYNEEDVDEVLAHFGVKGMHWGIRRRSEKTADGSDDHNKAAATKAKIKKSGTQSLSNEELQQLVSRMNLEQQFSSLAKKEPGRIANGQSKIKKILGIAKTVQEVHGVVTSPFGKSLGKLLSTRR